MYCLTIHAHSVEFQKQFWGDLNREEKERKGRTRADVVPQQVNVAKLHTVSFASIFLFIYNMLFGLPSFLFVAKTEKYITVPHTIHS